MTYDVFEQDGLFTVRDAAGIRRIADATWDDLLASLVRGDAIRLHLDSRRFSLRQLVLPDVPRARLRAMLPLQATGLFLMPEERLVLDCIPVGRSGDGIEVAVLALPKDDVTHLVTSATGAGIPVSGITIRWDDGLSVAGITEAALDAAAPDFVPDEFMAAGDDVLKRRIARTFASCIVIALLLVVIGESVRLSLLRRAETALAAELRTAYGQLFPGTPASDDILSKFPAMLTDLRQSYGIYAGTDMLDIIRRTGEGRVDGATVREISAEGNRVTIKGDAASIRVAEQFAGGLKSRFADVRTAESRNLPDGKTAFTLEATLEAR